MGSLSYPPRYNTASGALFGQKDFINTPNSPTLITAYLQNMFQNSGLPQGVVAPALNDLNGTITTFLQGVVAGWQVAQYHKQYSDPTSKVTWLIDAMFIWTCVNTVDYSQTPPTTNPVLLMTFIGTFYPIGSPNSTFVDSNGGEIFYNASREIVDVWAQDPKATSKEANSG